MVVVPDRNAPRGLLGASAAESCSRLESDLFEFPVAEIAVEKLGSRVVGDIDVWVPCSIEISPDHAQPVIAFRITQTRSLGNIGEGSIAVVMEERIASAIQTARAA